MNAESPLGKDSEYPHEYAPDVLHAIPRKGDRASFSGVDIWNAWELTWLGRNGQPDSAVAEIRIPADSPNIVESKSLKLYLGSLAMCRYAGPGDVVDLVSRDVGACVEAGITVVLLGPAGQHKAAELPGDCVDDADVDCDRFQPDASLLAAGDDAISESLHSHALRSLCPVTSQPDIGSLLVTYSGPRIDRASLLRYIVSYRLHNDFHESCVERMFLDIRERCRTRRLTVYARYQRRGGIDINPFRSDFEQDPPNLRLWRQ
ncbi:MAG: NADPH-dependent 7-cyano-7-deazaguanine reductase QueF [Woeseiaceae bacterium]